MTLSLKYVIEVLEEVLEEIKGADFVSAGISYLEIFFFRSTKISTDIQMRSLAASE